MKLLITLSLLLLFLPSCQSRSTAYESYLQARIEVAQQNIDNAQTLSDQNRSDPPYRRRLVHWNESDQTWLIVEDTSPFHKRFVPGHRFADAEGYVIYPNVDVLLEELELQSAKEDLHQFQSP